jgi:hypothetical protein
MIFTFSLEVRRVFFLGVKEGHISATAGYITGPEATYWQDVCTL